ncbi:hypothetical protein [Ensifer aridi]|uniref:hypothetical protein n=1 Tax=Ensifer aridi TaxID=1708715 RepID=UPI00358EED55
MFGIKNIGKITGSIARTAVKPDLVALSTKSLSSNLVSKTALNNLSNNPLVGGLAQQLLSKTLAENPALRDALLALQKQTSAGSAKTVAKAYSQF